MRRNFWVSTSRFGVVVATVLALTTSASPVIAGGNVTITDGDGVDYDAACVAPNRTTPPPPNSVQSPGTPSVGCPGTSVYDGSTESTDIRSVSLASQEVTHGVSDVQLVATCTLDQPIPAAGSTDPPLTTLNPDLPARNFTGSSCKVMFQVPARQNTLPTNGVGGGAQRPSPPGIVYDLHGHWEDGYHHFIAFDVQWDGTRWIHVAKIGTYDPLATGGFVFTELGTNNGGGGWQTSNSNAIFGINWNVVVAGSTVTVTVDGVLGTPCSLCTGGVFHTVYAKDGDTIVNIKGLSTTNEEMTTPATLPLSLLPAFGDVTVLGGFVFMSDTTEGNSGNYGRGRRTRPNISGIAYTPGPRKDARAGEWPGLYGNGPAPDELSHLIEVATWGAVTSLPDTSGPSPSCWTPTFGGTFPTNPFFNPDYGCQYDDDNTPMPNNSSPWTATDPGNRGTYSPEFWDTPYSFVA